MTNRSHHRSTQLWRMTHIVLPPSPIPLLPSPCCWSSGQPTHSTARKQKKSPLSESSKRWGWTVSKEEQPHLKPSWRHLFTEYIFLLSSDSFFFPQCHEHIDCGVFKCATCYAVYKCPVIILWKYSGSITNPALYLSRSGFGRDCLPPGIDVYWKGGGGSGQWRMWPLLSRCNHLTQWFFI